MLPVIIYVTNGVQNRYSINFVFTLLPGSHLNDGLQNWEHTMGMCPHQKEVDT